MGVGSDLLAPDPRDARIRELEGKLEESEETLGAIRRGDFDAVVVQGPNQEQLVYTLENADRPYRVLIEQIQEGAFTLSADGALLYGNPRMAAMLACAPEQLIGRSLLEFVDAGERPALARMLAEAGGSGTARGEVGLRLGAGAYLPAHVSLSRLRRGDGAALLCGILTDLTEQRQYLEALASANAQLKTQGEEHERIEEALRQSQKLEAIGQLTGGVAHDFNNLLTVIKSSTDLLKRPDLPEERRTRYVAAISNTVDRAARLTGQLLAFARRQTLKPEVFAACDGVRAITEMVGTLTGARIKLVAELPERRIFVNADPSQFDTALVNMAVNARDAMEGEGQITISVAPVEAVPAVRTHGAVEGPYVAISLSDTGSGIAPEKLDLIFEPFFTTKEVGKGTGLGLSQVFGFAKQSGGEVTVESIVGTGTTFTLYLPRVAAKRRRTVKVASPDLLTVGHDTCVLVVEDNADVGGFSVQALIELGYLPILAANADEALAELGRDAERFDVVFTDVVMPGLNGVDLAKEIRRLYPGLPVVLTSGYSHVLAQEGTHGFELLQKPYSVDDLSNVLGRAMRHHPNARPSAV